jgi:mannose-6-phosphate isomerase-like protein (cupin superfamily)
MAHKMLPPSRTSKAIKYLPVEDIGCRLSGNSHVWRRSETGNENIAQDEIVDVHAGISLTIPTGTHFRFRDTGNIPLCTRIATVPFWPGLSEPAEATDHWETQ